MAKVYVRVDDRLIHGQTVVAWCPFLGVKKIYAVDNASAANPMLKSIMKMGVPSGYEADILSVQEMLDILSKGINEDSLIIVRFPSVLEELSDEIYKAEYVILGNLAKRDDTNHNMKGATGIFYLSDKDISIIDTLVSKGLDVSFQQLPNTNKVTWVDFKNNF